MAASGSSGAEFLEIQIAARAFRKIHVAHRLQRHADQQLQPLARRLDERLDRHVVRNVVRRRSRWRAPTQNRPAMKNASSDHVPSDRIVYDSVRRMAEGEA